MPWDSVVSLAQDVIDKIFPDKTKAAEAKAALLQAQQQGELQQMQAAWDNAKSQLAVNQAEAANASMFVAGWRPWIGWVCGAAFAWTFVLAPFAEFILATAHVQTAALPALDLSQMMPVLLGMLGLGAMRSTEKIKGVKSPEVGH